MHNIALLACLVSVGFFLQGVHAEDCATQKVKSCLADFFTAMSSAGLDKTKICSAGDTYMKCASRIGTDCNLDPSSSAELSQAIHSARQQVAKAGCGDHTQDCVTPKIQSCLAQFSTALTSAGLDKTKICSTGSTFFQCAHKIAADCNLDSSNTAIINQAINSGKRQLTKAGCVGYMLRNEMSSGVLGNGACGSVYIILAIVVVCLHRLF